MLHNKLKKTLMLTIPLSVAGLISIWIAPVNSIALRSELACSVPTFTIAPAITVSSQAEDVAVGDYNNDGHSDLAVAKGNVAILLNDGTGAFGAPTIYSAFAGRAIATGDFNGDGNLDLATSFIGSNPISILLGNGNGTFGAATNYTVGTSPFAIVLSDFNNDGKIDIATPNYGDNNLSILLGNGLGGFVSQPNRPIGFQCADAAAGDFNGDGNSDLVLTPRFDNGVIVLLGNGQGGFANAPGSPFAVGAFGPESVAVDDYNGDGRADLAVGVLNNLSSNFPQVAILLGNGTGGFLAPNIIPVTGGSRLVVARDFSFDGNVDLALNTGSVLLGDGSGLFAPPVNVLPVNSNGVAVGEFNNDGKPDIALAGSGSTISLLINACTSTPPVIPSLSVSDIDVPEGDSGSSNGVFTVNLSTAHNRTVTVGYYLSGQNATNGADFQSQVGVLTFAPGVMSQPVNVAILGDVLDEFDETFRLFMANPLNATILDGQGVCTIVDNDPTPSIGVNGVSVVEGSSSTVSAVFPVSISAPSGRPVSVTYSTADITARTPSDYIATAGTLIFNPGETTKFINVLVNGDTIIEPHETFSVNLNNPSNVVIANGLGIGTITNDEAFSDFDGDGKTDVSVYRPSTGTWYILRSSDDAFQAQQFGVDTDRIVPGDFEGDGKTNLAVFRPSNGYWYILNGLTGTLTSQPFGQQGDLPAAGDYDGDGRTDIAVFRPSTGTFYLLFSASGTFHFQQWGATGDVPVMGDFDGDNKTDFAVFRPSISTFYLLRSSDGGFIGQQFGQSGDIPVAGDFDGDGRTDIAVFRPSNGGWYYLQSSDNNFRGIAWGTSGDVPTAGEYDGDGKTDLAVFRNGVWYILKSSDNDLKLAQFGQSGDVAVPSAYLP